MSVSQRKASKPFQYSRHTTPVSQARKDLKGLPVSGLCSRMIPLFTINVGQVC